MQSRLLQLLPILHNIGLDWSPPVLEDDHPNLLNIQEPKQPPHIPADQINIVNDLNPAARRNSAAVARDNYRRMMGPFPTDCEVRKMAFHPTVAEARWQARR
jgi:hypothetical protein